MIKADSFRTADGVSLKLKIKDQSSSEWVIVTHGVGEQSGRHSYWLEDGFTDRNVLLWDLQGHGESTGKRGHVKAFDQYLSDLDQLISWLAKEQGMKKFNLFGHSMGGLIVARWILTRSQATRYPEKVILSSPATGGGGLVGEVFGVLPDLIYSRLLKLPTLGVSGLLPLSNLSHDPKVEKAYVSDKLNVLKVHTSLYFDLLRQAKATFSQSLGSRAPLLCIIGSEDIIVNRKKVIQHFTTVDKNCKLVVVNGGYHELYQEIPKYRDQFLKSIQDFLGKA